MGVGCPLQTHRLKSGANKRSLCVPSSITHKTTRDFALVLKQACNNRLLGGWRGARWVGAGSPGRPADGSGGGCSVVFLPSTILTFFWLVAHANRDVLIPASKSDVQHRSVCRIVDKACKASTPRRNTGCHIFHASRRYTMRRPLRAI